MPRIGRKCGDSVCLKGIASFFCSILVKNQRFEHWCNLFIVVDWQPIVNRLFWRLTWSEQNILKNQSKALFSLLSLKTGEFKLGDRTHGEKCTAHSIKKIAGAESSALLQFGVHPKVMRIMQMHWCGLLKSVRYVCLTWVNCSKQSRIILKAKNGIQLYFEISNWPWWRCRR